MIAPNRENAEENPMPAFLMREKTFQFLVTFEN